MADYVNDLFGKFLRADSEEFLRANPALTRALSYLVMAAADVVKYSQNPEKRGLFSSETKLEKANRGLHRHIGECAPLAMQAVRHLRSDWEPHEALKFALSAFSSRYPKWQDAYSLFDAFFASMENSSKR